jgi:hypothetical protein
VLWAWRRGDACLGPAAGWVTFDGIDELRMSLAIDLGATGECDHPLVLDTLASLGMPARAHS